MKDAEMSPDFIGELAKYYRLENDLSNITVALCNSDELFKEKFIHFFFPALDVSRITDIQREVSDEDGMGSRVDIYITLADDHLPYLVEVKIGDRNHHFGQYEEAYKIDKSRLGYITNYYCSEGIEKGYDVKTWEGFYDYLKPLAEKDKLVKSYLSYLQQVCNIIIYDKTMKFSNLSSIPQFIATVKSLLEKEVHPANIWFSGQSLYAYDSAILKSFYFSYTGIPDKDGYGTVGLWFQDPPIVTIGVNSRPWLTEALLKHKESFSDSQYCSEPYIEEYWRKDDIWCDLKQEKMSEFLQADNVEQQKAILKAFIDEFLTKVKPLFD